MEQKKTTTLSNGLIWFGAAISIAEILTGILIAPLGIFKGLLAIIIGHLIGCFLLYLAGLIGAKQSISAMDTVKISFGKFGSIIFSSFNVIQLIGWTAVMIISGALAINTISINILSFDNTWLWSIVIGILIIFWILIGIKNLGKFNLFAMSALFVLTIVLCFSIFKDTSSPIITGEISFGAALELSIAMPLSWLPLISDYTMHAEKPIKATLVSSLVYFISSIWMYIIGFFACIYLGKSDVAQIMLASGLGIIAIIIIIASTVSTTFLDAYSSGVSLKSISKKFNIKLVAIIVTIFGTLLAIFTPITKYENFLYLIGSLFVPMITILLVDYFILKHNFTDNSFNYTNLIIWIIGFIMYRLFMKIDIFIGYTIPVMIIIAVLVIIVNFIKISYTNKNK